MQSTLTKNDQIKNVLSHFLLPLPYAENALNPILSANTINFHYEKHHKGYVDKLNKLIAETVFMDLSLEEIIIKASQDKKDVEIFNNAAQIWNHNFYWRSLKSKGGGKPPAVLKEKIDASFGSFEACQEALKKAATTAFGSGWTWLVQEGDILKVINTHDADTPFIKHVKPLFTLDIWEHAYYLDYQNRRPDYVQAVLEKLINWEFAAENLSKI